MSSLRKSEFENEVTFNVSYTLVSYMIARGIAISIGQMHPDLEGDMDKVRSELSSWDVDRVRREMTFHLEDYGVRLTPAWFLSKVQPSWLEFAGVIADSMPALVGETIEIEASLDHFAMRSLIEVWLDTMLDLRPLQQDSLLMGGFRIVRIPPGDFGLAEPPLDRAAFDALLQAKVASLDRATLDKIAHRMIWEEASFSWSARSFHCKPIEASAEALVQTLYPEIARCEQEGVLYRREVASGIYNTASFYGHVCDAHRKGREEVLGERPMFSDGSDATPRRCTFSHNIPLL